LIDNGAAGGDGGIEGTDTGDDAMVLPVGTNSVYIDGYVCAVAFLVVVQWMDQQYS